MNRFYFIVEGCKGFARNRFRSVASVLILGSSLLLVGIFLTLILIINQSIGNIDDFNEIVVYMKPDSSAETVKATEEKIKTLHNVDTVSFVSKAESLESEKDKFEGYEEIFDSYDDSTNPLPDSFRIEYSEIKGIEALVYNLEHLDIDGDGIDDEVVDKVKNRYDIAKNIENFKNVISVGGSWLMILLIAVSVFVISNTIRLTYHSRALEINVMRYIGATKRYITMPFMVEGAIIGLVSGIAGYAIQYYLYCVPIRALAEEYAGFISVPSLSAINHYYLIIYFATGLVIGVLGSALAIRKYLKA